MAEVKEKKAKAKPEGQGKGAEGKREDKKGGKGEKKPKLQSVLAKTYQGEVVPKLIEKFGYKNRMQVPRLEKIVINTSMREALQDVKILQTAANEIASITGQRPVITKAKKSISNFKLRQGQSVGARVTLRGAYMYEFVSRLVNVALPRVRDFKGVSNKSFDGRGNYTLGLTEQTIFPEIDFDKVQKINGMNITFVTTAKTDEEAKELLTLMGMPFRN
ncbi:MAG: 50S ribosomal protein L5 [Myxococcales bacterium]|nr:50S ribosomal protein L5 [Myxococcales bacterium]